MNYDGKIRLTLEGFYKVAVVDATGKEIWKQPEWKKNLILNQGMDALASMYPVEVMEFGIAGGGTRVNNLQGGESSGSAIGGWFYLLPVGSGIQDLNTTTYGGWIGGILDAGDLIRFNDGTDVVVTGVSDFSASLSSTITVASQSFAIWKTSQTGLQIEVKRCARTGITNASYFIENATSCYSYSSSVNQIHHQRIFDFASESILRNYNEVGVAWDADDSPQKSTFSRILLTSPVAVGISERLRLYYTLNVCYSPESASYMTNPSISGWPVSPAKNTNITQSLQAMQHTTVTGRPFYSYINNSNGTSVTNNGTLDVPSSGQICGFWLSTNSQSLVQMPSSPPTRTSFGTAATASSELDEYVLGSYQRTKYATFNPTQINFTTLKTTGFGNNNGGYGTSTSNGQTFAVMFEQTQSKYNTQALTFRYLWSWNRVLTSS